jgi:hypothetical protein
VLGRVHIARGRSQRNRESSLANHVTYPCSIVWVQARQEIDRLSGELTQHWRAPAEALIRPEQTAAGTQTSPRASGWLAGFCCCRPVSHGENVLGCDALHALLSALFFSCCSAEPGRSEQRALCALQKNEPRQICRMRSDAIHFVTALTPPMGLQQQTRKCQRQRLCNLPTARWKAGQEMCRVTPAGDQ